MKIKHIYLSIIGLLFVCSSAWADSTVELNKVVAVVNDQVITQQQLDQRFEVVKHRLEQQAQQNGPALPPDNILKRQVLEQLIYADLQVQLAKRANIEVGDQELDAALTGLAKQQHQTVNELKLSMAKQGVSYKELRDQLHDELLINEVQRQAVGADVTIGDAELESMVKAMSTYENTIPEYHLENILIPLPEVPDAEQVQAAKTTAQQVLQRIKSGETSFETAALANSSGQQAFKGGDLGWRKLEELPTPFANAVRSMKEGAVQGPIRTGNGYHIIKLLDVRGLPAKRFVTETHVKRILVQPDPVTSDSALKARLNNMRQKIASGEASFADLAEANSQDQRSAGKGGDMGWIQVNRFDPAFAKAVNQTNKGKISQPFKSAEGWQIIEVLGRRQIDDTANYRREQARQLLIRKKFDEQLQAWLQRLRDQAYIKVMEP